MSLLSIRRTVVCACRLLAVLLSFLPTRSVAQVTVTPDGSSEPNRPIHTTGYKATFTVFNGGSFGSVNTFKCSAASVVVCDSVKGSSIAPGNSGPVDVYYSVTNQGTGSITLRASGVPGTDDGFYTVPVTVPAGAPKITTIAFPEFKQDYTRCAAACFAASYAQATVPYFSLDKPRNVVLSYRGDRVAPKPFVNIDIAPDSGFGTFPSEYQLQVKVNGSLVTFLNGEQTLRFSNPGSITYRIGGQFDGSALTDGIAYPMEILVTSKIGASTFTNRWVTKYLSVKEDNSPIARGWTIANVPKAFVQLPDSSVLIKEGDGSATYFKRVNVFGVTAWEVPAGDFSSLTRSGKTWIRAYPDSTKVTFDSLGRAIKIADRWGSRDSVGYDASSRIVSLRDPINNITSLAYGANGLSTITDPASRVTTLSVAANKTLSFIQDPDNLKTNFGYDGSLRLSSITARNGKTSNLAYDASSGTLSTSTGTSIPLSGGLNGSPSVTLAAWQKLGVPYIATAVTPFAPVRPDTAYARVTEPGGALTRFSVNSWGSPRRTITPMADGLRDTTLVTYNTSGLPVRVVRPGYSGSDFDTLAYNANGQVTYSKAAGRTATVATYGPFAQLATQSGQLQDSTTYFIGANGRTDSIRVGNTTVAKIASYDAFGRPTTIRRPNADSTAMAYFATGSHRNLNTVTRSGNRTTTYRYDVKGRRVFVGPPAGPSDTLDYNDMNWVIAQRQRTAAGTLLTTTFQKDSLGNDTTVTDPKGQKYRFRYNALGWLIREEDPTGRRDTTQFSIDGDVMQVTDRRNQVVTFTYDSLHRVKTKVGTASLSYSYGNHGLQLVGSSPAATDTINFTVFGEPLTSITRMAGQRYLRSYHYTSSGLLDTVDVTGGVTLTKRGYGYDFAKGRLTGITLGAAQTTIGLDGALMDASRTFPGSGGTVQRTFGSERSPVKMSSTAGYGPTIERWTGYDLLGRVTNHLGANGNNGRFFVYDSLGRLQKAADSAGAGSPGPGCPDLISGSIFCHGNLTWSLVGTPAVDTFDIVGNRLSKGGAYGPGTNRITAFNGCNYKTDAAGSDSIRACSATDSTFFTWNKEGQLTGLNVKGQPSVTFDYDAFGRLVKKTSGATASYLLWDGEQLLAELGGTGTSATAEYSYYPGQDRLHAVIVGGTRYYAHTDGLGNLVALTDETATVKRTLSYDDWGQLTASSDPGAIFGNKDRSRWKGALWLGPETELYYMRNRWYEPRTGRFISEDPIGLRGGLNPAVFAGGDPISNRDPDGLGCERVYGTYMTYGAGNEIVVHSYSYLVCVNGGGGSEPGIDPAGGGRGRPTVFGYNPGAIVNALIGPPPESCSEAKGAFAEALAWDAVSEGLGGFARQAGKAAKLAKARFLRPVSRVARSKFGAAAVRTAESNLALSESAAYLFDRADNANTIVGNATAGFLFTPRTVLELTPIPFASTAFAGIDVYRACP